MRSAVLVSTVLVVFLRQCFQDALGDLLLEIVVGGHGLAGLGDGSYSRLATNRLLRSTFVPDLNLLHMNCLLGQTGLRTLGLKLVSNLLFEPRWPLNDCRLGLYVLLQGSVAFE